eukprot:CAMPEP_0194203738 /NCGR_PEP_ID=MMETSP0156-20130528/3436_1 /TAXON_ID=33649 /ORGANISM="Thalassionema nitzschioides, Strain L26-B" /LENGTH=144 /DNA_ID=CAMNT_0038929549 /DNA_START=46 /DNA_END=480 /DNA_ORIENTATION=-
MEEVEPYRKSKKCYSSSGHMKRQHKRGKPHRKREARPLQIELGTIPEGWPLRGDAENDACRRSWKTLAVIIFIISSFGFSYFFEASSINNAINVTMPMRYRQLQEQALDYYQQITKKSRDTRLRRLAIQHNEDQQRWLRRIGRH